MPEISKGTVFVLGGRSFMGGHLCRTLIKNGYHVLLHSTTTKAFDNLYDVLPHPQVTPVHCKYDELDKVREFLASAQYAIYATPSPGKQTIGQAKHRENEYQEFAKLMGVLATAKSIKKSVFISTCSIFRLVDGLADESCLADKPFGWEVVKQKMRFESLVMDHFRRGLNIVLVNPTMYVGEYDSRPSSGEYFKFAQKAPFLFLKGTKSNIVDTAAAARGTIAALERGRAGERYILSGENIYFEDFMIRIKKLAGKKTPWIVIPFAVTVTAAFFTELLNMIMRRPKPLIPLMGIELQKYGVQHYNCDKAKKELGYDPGDSWDAVDRGYLWYKTHGIIKD